MKNIYIIIIVFAAIVFTSCEKNVLDKGPLDVVDQSLIWSDPSVAQLYVNDIYLSIAGHYYWGKNRWNAWDNYDNLSDLTEGGHSWLMCYTFNYGQLTSEYNPYAEDWTTYYAQIRSTNIMLDNADQLKGDENLIKTIKGEATFLRAYYYFKLVRNFGGVPLITHAQNLTDSLSVSRNSYDECAKFIVDEMDKAADLLPTTWSEDNVGRATKGAALAVKGQMLLDAASKFNNPSNDRAKWQKAADANKAVIDLTVYSLYPDYAKLFLDDNNQEVIFDMQFAYPYLITGSSEEIVGSNYELEPQSDTWGMVRPTQEYIDMFEMTNGKVITDPESGYDPQNPYTNRDPRFYYSIYYNGSSCRGKTVETFVNGINGPGLYDAYGTSSNMTGYYCRKLVDESIPGAYLVDEIKANWILIRYAQILLNYAEAEIELGNEAEARTYINMVRERVGMPPTEASGEALVKLYRNERAIELGMEGERYFDIRRWKIAEDILNGSLHKMMITKNNDGSFSYDVQEMAPRSFPERMYLWPIPINEIQKNANLAQNPGY